MGWLLMIPGGFWAFTGFMNIMWMDYTDPLVRNYVGAALMFNMTRFIVPGLAVFAIGWLWRRRMLIRSRNPKG
jgi:hypothetical protein